MDTRSALPTRSPTRSLSRRRLLAGVPGLALLPILPVGRLAGGEPPEPGAARNCRIGCAWPGKKSRQPPQVRIFKPAASAPHHVPWSRSGARLNFQNRSPAAADIAEVMGRIEPDLRSQLARVFGAGDDEVALTHSTSEGISHRRLEPDWRPRRRSRHFEHRTPGERLSWYVLRDRFGIVIREIDLSPGTDVVAEVREQLSPKTRVVSLSHVSRNNGRTLRTEDSARLAGAPPRPGCRYHLDGAQGPGCVATDFAELGCDCYSTCGHKWLLGPKGTGALFVRRAVLDEVQLSLGRSATATKHGLRGQLHPAAERRPLRSSGTRALADFYGFGQAVQWMEDIGLERILTPDPGPHELRHRRRRRTTGTRTRFARGSGRPLGDPGGPAT